MARNTSKSTVPAFQIVVNKVKSRPGISLGSLANELRGYVSPRTGRPLSKVSLQAYLSTARNLPESNSDSSTSA